MTSVSSDSRRRTPKKKKRKESTQRGHASDSLAQSGLHEDHVGSEDPVMVLTVPVTSPSGPLQGSARVVKDHCADWHNYIDRWHGLNDKGLAVVNQIVTAKLQTQHSESPAMATLRDKGTDVKTDAHGIVGTQMPKELEGLCADLCGIVQSLDKLVKKMAAITKHLRGVCDMERRLGGSHETRLLFKTWPVHLFWETSARLGEMYSRELALKRAIMEDVAHANSRDVLMTYTSSWLHQPYIDEGATLLVESMLQETGHR